MQTLIIDDDERLVDCWQELFDSPNVTVVRCQNLQEALEALATHAPHLFFFDHNLGPGSDGGQGFEILKHIPSNCIPVSTTGDPNAASQYKALGVHCICKIDIEAIKSFIHTIEDLQEMLADPTKPIPPPEGIDPKTWEEISQSFAEEAKMAPPLTAEEIAAFRGE